MAYGPELILDLHGCNVFSFRRKSLKKYCKTLCRAIDMKPEKLVFWDDKWTWLWKLLLFWDKSIKAAVEPHTKGTSAVQFILTSSITIHTLSLLGAVYINIFSCKSFNRRAAEEITKNWFEAKECKSTLIERI